MKCLHADNITITIGHRTICQQLNLTVQAGELWGILGANGSGKTTLLQTLAGLHPTLHGEIWLHKSSLNKIKLKDLAPKIIAQSIGMLFQDFTSTFSQTVLEYCKAGRYPHLASFQKESFRDRQIVMDALGIMDLHTFTHQNITQLSGGEKRRLALASILAQTPSIFLLDEPTNHLDVYHQMRVLHHFHQLTITEFATVMMSLHDVNLAQQFCTHILLLFSDGSTLQGRTQDILTVTNLSRLYQHKMNVMHTSTGVYWQPKSDITM